MTQVFDAKHIHLTGYKGVAMTSIAQCLHDLGISLSGSDLAEDFVTKDLLKKIPLQHAVGFDASHIPTQTQLLIYTAAHKGPQNLEVTWAKEHHIPCMSQAEALSQLFNAKKGIAVCGVGGKSTTSAMLSWMFTKLNIPVSFSVGVGNINGLDKTGQWQNNSEYFVAEADEYVIDPQAAQLGQKIIPRFSFLKPQIIICTQIAFDHPDVYKNFEHTKQVFLQFFLQLKPNGVLIIDGDQTKLQELANQVKAKRADVEIMTFGKDKTNMISYGEVSYQDSKTTVQVLHNHEEKTLTMLVPGKHNVANACASILAANAAHISVEQSIHALSTFQSTQRRFEFKGEKNGVLFYDDYAHHPREIQIIIETLLAMFPHKKIVVAFQPHTFSRTKALFQEFAQALSLAPRTLITEIFASAREAFDPTITARMLVEEVQKITSSGEVIYIQSLEKLAEYCTNSLPESSVFITLGAGDIYSVHDKIFSG